MTVDARILVVDDDPIARAVIEGHLVGEGATVTSVASVDAALAQLDTGPLPDVVLCDVMMPERDGFELCDHVRADEGMAHLPFVFVTALGDRDAKLRALEAGADELLAKPVDEVELLARVRSLTTLSRTRQRLAGRERFVAILDSVGEGIVTLDVSGRVIESNEAAVRLLDLGSEPVGVRISTAIGKLEHLRDEPRDGGHHTVLRRPPVGDGEDLYLGVTSRPVDDHGEVAHIVVVRDITGEERSRYAGELVINSIVHKFRTPLTGLSGALEILERTDLTDPQKSLIGILRNSTSRLDGALRRVLEFADREASGRTSGTVLVRTGEVAVLAALVGDLVRPIVSRAQVELDASVVVSADALAVALEELVSNATAAAGPDGVSVSVTGGPHGIQVVVEDDGGGIPPEDAGRVFDEFFQVDRTGQASGMGLGLPLVRHVVESVGGSVTVASIPSGPTRFRATIPAVLAASQTAVEDTAQTEG